MAMTGPAHHGPAALPDSSGPAGGKECAPTFVSVSPDDRKLYVACNYGNSLQVRDAAGRALSTAAVLYHGTATRFLAAIQKEGLKPGQRQYVHLSEDVPTATAVGQRYGKSVVLTIAAGAMHSQGHSFYQAENGVWLTPSVPSIFLNS